MITPELIAAAIISPIFFIAALLLHY